MIAVLAGGVGAARFLRGLMDVIAASEVTAIVNTGDDTVLHGLHISPDIDTVTYTLANAIDPERGWGLRDETWAAMSAGCVLPRRNGRCVRMTRYLRWGPNGARHSMFPANI